jgi:type II secretory pathway component GspD/PulD (secretin)
MIKNTIAVFCLILAFADIAFPDPNGFTPAPPAAPAPSLPLQPALEIGRQIDKFLERGNRGTGGPPEGTADNLISLNFKEVPIGEAITVLSKQAGINITLDRDVQSNLAVTSVYSGASVENALKSITSGMDLRHKRTADGFLILPWSESYIDINKVYQFGNGSSQTTPPSFGGINNQQLQQMGMPGVSTAPGLQGNAAAQTTQFGSNSILLADFGGYMDSIISMIKPLLSRQGVVTYMPTGFVYVKDYPSRVKAVEEMFNVDNDKREEVNIKITILRIDYNKEYESGISWNKVFEGFKVGSPVTYNIAGNFLSNLANQRDNVFTFNYKNTLNNIDVTAKLLSRYGNVKIVHSWETRALTGSVIPFDLTQLVWYSSGSVIQVINNQTITTPQISNTPVGLSIVLNPLKHDEKYLVNTSIKMSSVVSQQTIGDLTFPNIENNAVSVPIKMLPGEQIAVSGFKIKNTTKNTVGIPLLSQIPILEYLFGFKTAQDHTSEIVVVISLNRKKGEKEV